MWKSYCNLTNVAIYFSRPLDTWLTTTTIMLKKDKRGPRTNRLRISGNFEANSNLLFKFFWHKLITKLAK